MTDAAHGPLAGSAMTIFELVCIGGAALAAVVAGARLLMDHVPEGDESLEPTLYPAAVQARATAKKTRVIHCHECGHDYGARAVVCPYCGEPPRVAHGFGFVPLLVLFVACIVYTTSFDADGPDSPAPAWSQAPPLQKLRATLIAELESKHVITAIQAGPHVVTVTVEQPAFRALQQFEQQTIGGTVFGYYFDGANAGDYVALEDARTHQGLGWFNRWGLHLADAAPAATQSRK